MPAALGLLSSGVDAVRCGYCALLLDVCSQARPKIAKLGGAAAWIPEAVVRSVSLADSRA